MEDCNWMDIEKYLEKDNRVIIVLGANEQHGLLSVSSDTKIPMSLADAASARTGVLVAPPLNFGVSPYFLNFPGTISSLYQTGFRRILLLNGHGGNSMVQARLIEMTNQLPALQLRWYSWWMEAHVTACAKSHGLDSNHANWIEAFRFTKVTDLPHTIKPNIHVDRLANSNDVREKIGDGQYGGPYEVTDEIMDEMFAIMVHDVIEMLSF